MFSDFLSLSTISSDVLQEHRQINSINLAASRIDYSLHNPQREFGRLPLN
jgi:hypothetical protein